MTDKEMAEFVETSEAAKMVWNAAIEAACKAIDYNILCVAEIRKLKK